MSLIRPATRLTARTTFAPRTFVTSVKAFKDNKGNMEYAGETLKQAGQAFKSDGAVGKQFEADGNIGQVGEAVGGPFSSKGAIGKEFTDSGSVGGSVEKAATDTKQKGEEVKSNPT